MAGASKFGGTENGADCSKCGGTVAVLFKTRNGTSLITSTKPHEWSVGLHMITKKHRALFSERRKSTNFLRKTQMKKRREGSTVIGPPGGAHNTIKTKTNQCFQIKSINQLILTFTTVFERVILIFLLDYRFINNDILLIGRLYIPLLHGNAILAPL